MPLRIIIVDDNPAVATTAKALLDKAGFETRILASSVEALEAIPAARPDAVLLDIMMPGLDGLGLCEKLRATPGLENLKIIIFSSKAFEYDRRRAAKLGADGYILKPIKAATFVADVNKYLLDQIQVRFWGVRGTLPVPGAGSLRYGGNTSCVALTFPQGHMFIFDAGTGIRMLGNELMASGARRIKAKIFISHPHWDHINALPFFTPLFVPGNHFEIIGCSQGGDRSIEKLVSEQMEEPYFPITVGEWGANVTFRDLDVGTYDMAFPNETRGSIEVKTMLLSHPGQCLGYRVNYGGRSICYVTDNELYLPESEYYHEEYVEHLADFVRGTDHLITDTTYLNDEYPSRVGWGHSCVSRVVDLALRAEVKQLCLFHHDPSQDDDAIDRKLELAQKTAAEAGARFSCVAPIEGSKLMV